MASPLTDQQLNDIDAVVRNAALIGADIDPGTADALVAEVRRLRTALVTAQADTLAEVATELEEIDFHPNAKSTCSDLCRLLADRFRRQGLAALDAIRSEAASTDTLPAWLAQRFDPRGPAWGALTDDDRSYWAHQAAAVRRAVARGGFKTAPAARPAGAANEDSQR